MNKNLTIGKVAKEAGVNIQTLRYYDRIGLVPPVDHRDSGYRLYSTETVKQIIFIKNAQDLGFTLDEVGSLLKLKLSKRAKAKSVREKTKKRLKDVEKKISGLKAIQKVLKGLIHSCHTNKTTDHCPILRSLEKKR